MILVGLTGNIAAGKSTVSRMLAEHGATVIDADVLARRAVEPGTPALAKIVAHWGPRALAPDGTLDRAWLRRTVFDVPEEVEALNEIVHPEVAVLREAEVAAARARGDRVVVCDIPLLFEKRLVHDFDRIVLVDAPRALRLERLMHERNLTHDEAVQLIAAQMPAELKRASADFIIDNYGSLEELAARVDEVWAALARDADAQAHAPAGA